MESTQAIQDLVTLGRQRWLVAVMAEMHGRRGARFIELLNAIGIARESLSRTIDQALELGWIVRNPGHGHPMRPEYVLTREGQPIAQAAARIARTLGTLGIEPAGLTRWSLALLYAMYDGADRFSMLSRILAPATPRALSQGLKALAANDLVDREVEEGFPPTSRYRLTVKGRDLVRLGFSGR